MKYMVLILVGLAGVTDAGVAQTAQNVTWPPAVGVRARVQSSVLGGERQVGTVEGVTGDTLRFRREDGVGPTSLTPSQINTIEVSGGTHTAKAKWAAVGFLLGAATGAAIGGATYSPCRDSFACIGDIGGRSASVGFGAMLGGLTGAVAGTLWGAQSRETWIPLRR
jgi:hypothetical protein